MFKKILFGVLLLLAVAVSLAWFVDFDATELGSAALREVSASTGIRLEASRHRIHVFRGLELDDVEASARFPGGRYAITIPAMRFQHRPLSLVGGTLELESVALIQPRVAIVTGLAPELAPELTNAPPRPAEPRRRSERSQTRAAESLASPVALLIRELELVGAAFSFNDDVSLTGVDLRLESPTLAPGALTILHAVDAKGRLSIQELSLRATKVRSIVATLGASGGRFDLEDGFFETERARVRVTSVHMDFNSVPVRYRLSLSGRHSDVPGEVSFEGSGFGLDGAKLKGKGNWSRPPGVFDEAPLWKIAELAGSDYEATEVPFTVADGRIVVEGDWARGTIELDGELDLIVGDIAIGGTLGSPVRR